MLHTDISLFIHDRLFLYIIQEVSYNILFLRIDVTFTIPKCTVFLNISTAQVTWPTWYINSDVTIHKQSPSDIYSIQQFSWCWLKS